MKDQAIEYATQVVNGDLIAGQLVKLSCQRFLNDLDKQNTKDFPYFYSEQYAAKVIKFVSSLPQTNGEPLELEPFEIYLLSNIYGWRQVDDHSLRFNRVLLSMARKNGKSFILATIGVIALLMEKQPARNRQVLYTANSSQQAHLAFDIMSDQLRALQKKSKYLRSRVKINKQRVDDKESGSFAIPLSTDTHSTDGYNPTLGIIDEYHQARDDSILNALKSGMTQQDNGILAIISTAGFSLSGPFKKEWDYCVDVLKGKVKNDRYFCLMYCLDSPKEVFDQKNWIKANPLMSNKKIAKTMTEQIQSDLDVAVKQNNVNNVLVKNMNLFVQQSAASYISLQEWERGLIEEVPDIHGKDVYIGLDLSRRGDLTGVSWLVPVGDGKFYADSVAFVGWYGGIEKKSKADGFDYQAAAQRGECSISTLEAGTIDYTAMFNWIIEFVDQNELKVKALVYDPYNIRVLEGKIEAARYPAVELVQSRRNLSIPIRRLKDDVLKGNILHTDNKLLAFNVDNTILRFNFNGQPVLDKERGANKIDCMAALLDAYVIGMDYYRDQKENEILNNYYSSDAFLK